MLSAVVMYTRTPWPFLRSRPSFQSSWPMLIVTSPCTTDPPRNVPSCTQRSLGEKPSTSQYHLIDAVASFTVNPGATLCSPFARAAAGLRPAFARDRSALDAPARVRARVPFAFSFTEDFDRALVGRFIFLAIVSRAPSHHLTAAVRRVSTPPRAPTRRRSSSRIHLGPDTRRHRQAARDRERRTSPSSCPSPDRSAG